MATVDVHEHQDQVQAQVQLERLVTLATVGALLAAAAVCGWYVYTRVRANQSAVRDSLRPPSAPSGPAPEDPPPVEEG